MVNNRPLPEKKWYKWYDWLISQVPESVSDVKEKIMKVFQIRAYNSIFKDWKPKKKNYDAFNDKYIESGKNLSIEKYLEEIKPYLCNMIDELKKSGKWKMMKFNFMLSKK